MKRGRFGQFLACTGYPECKTTRKVIATKQGMTAAKPDQILDEKCPKCDSNLVHQAGPVRRVHRVQQLSDLQVRQAEVHRPRLPQGRRRRRRAQVAAREGVLRLRQLSGLRLRAVEPADSRAVPAVRREVPGREDHQAARPSADVPQGGLRLRALRGAGAGVTRGRELRRGGGRQSGPERDSIEFTSSAVAWRAAEAAWQAASLGVPVTLHEMRPVRADGRPQDRSAGGAGLQQFVPRRQAR